MTTLQEAVQKSLKARRTKGSPRTRGTPNSKATLFTVRVEFEVTHPKYIDELVSARNAEEAETLALEQFKNKGLRYRVDHGENGVCPKRAITISNGRAASVMNAKGVSLSATQRGLLIKMIKENRLLYEKGWDRGYQALTKVESRQSYVAEHTVLKTTVKALFRKGLIIPVVKKTMDTNEYRTQKALGTLPPDTTLMVDMDAVKRFRLRLGV